MRNKNLKKKGIDNHESLVFHQISNSQLPPVGRLSDEGRSFSSSLSFARQLK
jgi:hypothetical protein